MRLGHIGDVGVPHVPIWTGAQRYRLPIGKRAGWSVAVVVVLGAIAAIAVPVYFAATDGRAAPTGLGAGDRFEPWQRASLLGLAVVYLIVVIFGYPLRGSMSARVAAAYADGLLLDLQRLDPSRAALREPLTARLEDIRRSLDGRFLSQREVLGAWRRLHALDTRLAPALGDAEVKARLLAVAERLVKSAHEPRRDFGKRIKNEMKSLDAASVRVELSVGLGMYYNGRDTRYEGMAAWERRVSGITVVALIVMVLLGVLLEREVLIVLGAVGGLLSRLLRVYRSAPSPSDYGLSWSILLLSPVVGGLAGWAGTLLTSLLASEEVDVIGAVFRGTWDDPFDVPTLAIAFVFGFSERLLERVVRSVEHRVTPSEDDTQGASEESPAGAGGGGVS